jgi:glycosyltransferase involved in cell wall biosynthesis
LRKKIVLVGPAHPYRGGNALYVSFVYDILKDLYDVKVVNFKLLYPSILFPGTTQKDVSGKIIKNVPNERLINSINPFSWFKTAKYIKKENPDLVIFDWWNPFFGMCYYFISKLIKAKKLFITENVISHEGRFVDKSLTKIGLKNSDAFLVLSDVVEDEVKNYSGNKPVYKSALPVYDCYNMNNDVDKEKFKTELGFNKDDIILLFFGYVRKYKGLNVLIDAFKKVNEIHPETKLLIVGEFYDSSEKYHNQIQQLGLNDKIKIVERFVANEEVGNYYAVSNLVVLPYLSATQSGVLNISYGFQKPVVVTGVGGLAQDVIEDSTGFICEPDNPVSLKEKIIRYLDLKDKVNFAENIKIYLQNNEFRKLPEKIKQIIEDLK